MVSRWRYTPTYTIHAYTYIYTHIIYTCYIIDIIVYEYRLGRPTETRRPNICIRISRSRTRATTLIILSLLYLLPGSACRRPNGSGGLFASCRTPLTKTPISNNNNGESVFISHSRCPPWGRFRSEREREREGECERERDGKKIAR